MLNENTLLDRFLPPARLSYLGHAYYTLREYRAAVLPLRESIARVPNMRIGHLWLAAAYAKLGKLELAQETASEVLRIEPKFALTRWRRTAVYRNPEDEADLLEGLQRAGLP